MDKQDIEKYKKEIEQSQLREQVQRKEDMHKELLGNSLFLFLLSRARGSLIKYY